MISHHASSNAQELKPADNLLWPHTKGLSDLMPEVTLIQAEHAPPRPTHQLSRPTHQLWASCNPPKNGIKPMAKSIPQPSVTLKSP